MNHSINKYVCEFLGAFVLTFVVALSLVNSFPLPTLVLAGLVLTFFVYTIGKISGSHINPGVTVGLWSIGKINTQDAIVYIIVQLLGGFVAGFMVYEILGNVPMNAIAFDMNTMLAEVVGMIIFTFGIASIVFSKAKSENIDELSGIVIGFSLILGISVAALLGSIGGLNPAVVVGLQVYDLAYLLGPIIGSVIGFNLYKFLQS